MVFLLVCICVKSNNEKESILAVLAILVFVIVSFFWISRKINSEVLDAFRIMNAKFEESNTSVQSNFDSLVLQVSNTDYANKMKTLNSLSKNLNN